MFKEDNSSEKFVEEKKQLQSLQKTLHSVEVPTDRLDNAIMAGVKKGQQRRSNKKLWQRTSLVAVLLFLLFTSFIRVSDTFASYVTKVPGLEKFVELIRYDKGLSDALEHEYIQSFDNLSVEKDGLKLTIDSVIVDEMQMFLFYTIETTRNHEHVWSNGITLTDGDGKEIVAAVSYGGEEENLQKVKQPVLHRTDFSLYEPLNVDKLKVAFKFKEGNRETDDGKELAGEWQVELPIDQTKIAKSKVFDVNKTVTVEGQNITVKRVTIYPTRVAVLVSYDPQNTKEIFAIEDIRLVNEYGDARTALHEGITISNVGKYEREFFLQSNYFNDGEQLYLRFSNLRALDKNELDIIVDPERSEIIQAPTDRLLKKFHYDREGSQLVFDIVAEPHGNQLVMPAILYKGEDSLPSSGYGQGDDGTQRIYIPYSPAKHGKGPITLTLKDYPARIHDDVEIKIK